MMALTATVEDFQALGILIEPQCWKAPKFRCDGDCRDVWPIRDQHVYRKYRFCPVCAPAGAVKSAELKIASR